jgi:uncharacterized SAM-binding protein YcdF (DUF218 family)
MMPGLRNLLASLALPPLLLLALVIMLGLLGWRGRRGAALAASCAAAMVMLLATPLAAGLLAGSLDHEMPSASTAALGPGAVIILGADVAHGAAGPDIGPLTLERLRAGAALHRRLGLPILVTAGPAGPGEPSLAALMAESLRVDFGVSARWIEPAATDTRDNAQLSTAMLRGDGIAAAHLVTHAWHMPRAIEAFTRAGLVVQPAPVRRLRLPDGRLSDMVPRPDHLALSWFAMREWAGRLVYVLRDGS